MMAKTGSTVAALSTSLDTSVTDGRYCVYVRSNVKEEEQTAWSWGVRTVHEAVCVPTVRATDDVLHNLMSCECVLRSERDRDNQSQSESGRQRAGERIRTLTA